MTEHTSDDEFGRRLSIALHDAVPLPPADLVADLDPRAGVVTPIRRAAATRRAAPWLAAAAVVAVGAAVALVAADHRGGDHRPNPVGSRSGGRSSGPASSCVLGAASVVDRTVTPRRTQLVVRLPVGSTPPCLLPARPEVDFVGTDTLPFLPAAVTDTAPAGRTVRVTGRAAEFTLVLDSGCANPRRYASLRAGTQYGGVSGLAAAGTVCTATVGAFRSVR